jgi:hypothetical protein
VRDSAEKDLIVRNRRIIEEGQCRTTSGALGNLADDVKHPPKIRGDDPIPASIWQAEILESDCKFAAGSHPNF